MSRFDYVKYDNDSAEVQAEFKRRCQYLEEYIDLQLTVPSRARAIAINKLEECYMWIGKGIRDAQIARNGSAELQEERKNG